MKIVRLASKQDINAEDVRNFINRFNPQLPGLRQYYNDPLALKYMAKMLKVFANANDFVSFSFQLRSWLSKYEDDKKKK